MDLSGWLLVSGIVVMILASLAPRLSPGLGARQRWIRILGLVLLIVGFVTALPDMVKGAREGWRDAKLEHAEHPSK